MKCKKKKNWENVKVTSSPLVLKMRSSLRMFIFFKCLTNFVKTQEAFVTRHDNKQILVLVNFATGNQKMQT